MVGKNSQVKKLYASFPKPHRKTILKMRKSILEIVPDAEEIVSYGMPAFKIEGNVFAGLLAHKNHIGYYPFSGSILNLFARELKGFSKTKSALHVPIDQPLSKSLLSKLIKARISQCSVKQGKVNLDKYKKLDGVWRDLGIAAPARRGLVDNRIIKTSDLAKLTELEVTEIHGIGENAMRIIRAEMRKQGLRFR